MVTQPHLSDPEKDGVKAQGGVALYDDRKLGTIAHMLGTLAASLLPVLSIFVLYFVTNMLDRLFIILAFSTLFSFTLYVFTRARGSVFGIFAATAA